MLKWQNNSSELLGRCRNAYLRLHTDLAIRFVMGITGPTDDEVLVRRLLARYELAIW